MLIYSTLLAVGNAAVYSPKRTKLNKNSAAEIAIMELENYKRGLLNIISQTISCIKEGWDTLQTISVANCQNIKSLKIEIKKL